jgi:capsular polysaccharide biosynthesis protein
MPDGAERAGAPERDDASLWFYRPTAAVVIWRRKFWILLFAILVGVGTYYGARIPSPSYGSSAVIEVTMQTSGAQNDTLLAANQLAAQYAQLATTSAVLTEAAASIKASPGDLASSITASTVSQLNLVKVSASGSSPAESQARANAAARVLTNTILRSNARKAKEFLRKAEGPLTGSSKQIAKLEAEIAQSTFALATATTVNGRTRAQTVLTGQQALLTALTSQQNGAMSALAVDAALGQPAVSIVSHAGPGSRTRPSPLIYALIGGLAGAIVVSQLFVLADSLRRAQRAISSREQSVRR